MELVADVGKQDGEGRAVELVDRVEPEQHHQREGRLTLTDVAQPSARVAARGEEPAHQTVSSTGRATAGACGPGASGSTLRPGLVSRRTHTSRIVIHSAPRPPGSINRTNSTPAPVDSSCHSCDVMN